MDINEKIKTLEEKHILLTTENKVTNERIKEIDEENIMLLQNVQDSLDGVEFVEQVALNKRSLMKIKIESLVTEALKNVYGNNYSIEFDYSLKNNRTNVEILLVKKTSKGEIRRNMDGFGGGVSDTISLPLKLLVLMATKEADKILLTDEPGKHLDYDRVEPFADFVHQLSKRLGVQVIFCSHHKNVRQYADVIYHVTNPTTEESIVKRIK